MVERERLTLETLGVQKWREIKARADCHKREEEKVAQI